jgi:hypothetical protein
LRGVTAPWPGAPDRSWTSAAPALADAPLEARIAELVEQHRAELEQLIDHELDRRLEQLVGECARLLGPTICQNCKGAGSANSNTVASPCDGDVR